ncbi:MAG: ankyrin repeat domain-containing protein [Candidatus Poribacteria bacterium]|nr:ankyrin repeat domain-containing protein [Candidatus Poribacteria bacterium]MDE0505880.1 ankyrin repeat domain-containing protein [Candidatus Poribacteria bacterium]
MLRLKITYTVLGVALVLGSVHSAAIAALNAEDNENGAHVDAIIKAVREGDFAAVKSLVEGDSRLANARAKSGARSIIQIAAEKVVWHRPRYRKIVQYLADNGAEYDIFTAARAGLLAEVRRMLKKTPDLIKARDYRDYTPLQCASLVYGTCEEAEAVMDYLLAKGAEIDILTASHFGMLGVVQDLLEDNPTCAAATDADGLSPLHWAVRPRRGSKASFVRITELLIQHGADVNAQGKAHGSWTPMHTLAEWAGYLDQADLMLKAGAEINAETDLGWTPLDFAVDRGRQEMIVFLREKGAETGEKR